MPVVDFSGPGRGVRFVDGPGRLGDASRAAAVSFRRVVVAGLEVHIYSTQRVRVGAVACTRELRLEQNVVPVTVELPGTATIRVHGWRSPEDAELVLTRSVNITN